MHRLDQKKDQSAYKNEKFNPKLPSVALLGFKVTTRQGHYKVTIRLKTVTRDTD